MALLSIKNIRKSFEDTVALDGISFSIERGEIIALLGPSGCGKSTLLNIIAGIETPDGGEILWENASLRNILTHKRGFGLMFQDYALFPHLSVANNIAFGLKMAGNSSTEIARKVNDMLALVNLEGYGGREIGTLSGGEQQRVALARSLAPNPRLLMLDEPLGALDRTLRERLMSDLRRILRSVGQTAIYVTHDQEEAFAVADRVVLMNRGQIEQFGTPEVLYRKPASVWVARFFGFGNILDGRVEGGGIWTEVGLIPLEAAPPGRGSVSPQVLIRPDGARVPPQAGSILLEGVVQEKSFRGSQARVTLAHNGTPLTFELPARLPLPDEGKILKIGIQPEAVQIFWESIE